jgi:hypothetical protein
MIDPCKSVDAGTTVRSLAAGYISNTSCIDQYKALLEKQRQWKVEQINLYKNLDKKKGE